MTINREDLAWAAGLFEGEGCFFIHPLPGRVLGAKISMTDEDVVQQFAALFPFGHFTGPHRRGRLKPYWAWRTHKFETVQALIVMLWPWLGKRRRATAVSVLLAYKARAPKGDRKNPVRRAWRLTPAIKRAIRTTLDRGTLSQAEIARQFKVSYSLVSHIANRQVHRDVQSYTG